MTGPDSEFAQRIAQVRRFNRFYTRKIGALDEGAYGSPFSLTAVRVLYELAHRDRPTATELAAELGLDAGYLSRILRGFERRGLLARARAKADRRQSLLSLTARGRRVFAPLNARSHDDVGAMLRALSAVERRRVVEAMQTIAQLFGERAAAPAPYLLRPPQPGDMGWVVHRHGALYAQDYGYDEEFEALVAEIVAQFIRHRDAKRDRCWIAEQEGEVVGSVFLVTQAPTVGQLRLLLVEPKARGLGIGSRLVNECVRFARQVGHRKIMLWTQSELVAARKLYEAAGFRLVQEEPHHSFGHDLIGETWELEL